MVEHDINLTIVFAGGEGHGNNESPAHLIRHYGEKIMSAISDFSRSQDLHNQRQDDAITDIAADITGLKETIAALQASPGTITPEDQVLLDNIDKRAETISTKLEALNALTPPNPPSA